MWRDAMIAKLCARPSRPTRSDRTPTPFCSGVCSGGLMLEYKVTAKRADAHGSIAKCKDAEIVLDTDVNGRPDAFNPAELFLAALAACMLKSIERATPMLKFNLHGVEVGSMAFGRTARREWRRSTMSSSSIPMRAIAGSNCCTPASGSLDRSRIP